MFDLVNQEENYVMVGLSSNWKLIKNTINTLENWFFARLGEFQTANNAIQPL